MFTKSKPTFASAMKTFTQAQAELKEAGIEAEANLNRIEKEWAEAKTEHQNIGRVSAFFDKLLRGATVDEVAELGNN